MKCSATATPACCPQQALGLLCPAGLELLEELLIKGDRQRVVTQMAVEGLLAALVSYIRLGSTQQLVK